MANNRSQWANGFYKGMKSAKEKHLGWMSYCDDSNELQWVAQIHRENETDMVVEKIEYFDILFTWGRGYLIDEDSDIVTRNLVQLSKDDPHIHRYIDQLMCARDYIEYDKEQRRKGN